MSHSARIKAAVEAGDVDAMRNEYQDWLTEEMDKREVTKRERDEAIRQRDELRAVLAPLLDDPLQSAETDYGEVTGFACLFCTDDEPHAPDCPALPANRDRLLGRDRAPAPADTARGQVEP